MNHLPFAELRRIAEYSTDSAAILDAIDALERAEPIAEAAREYRDIVGRLADDASPAAYDAADDAQDRMFAAVDAERAERGQS